MSKLHAIFVIFEVKEAVEVIKVVEVIVADGAKEATIRNLNSIIEWLESSYFDVLKT